MRPFISEPRRLGLPWHGLVRNGQLPVVPVNDEPITAPPVQVDEEQITAPDDLTQGDRLVPVAWVIDTGQLVELTTNPAGTTYAIGTDYTVSAGGVTLLTAGNITAGQSLLFSYVNADQVARTSLPIYVPGGATVTSNPAGQGFVDGVDFVVGVDGVAILPGGNIAPRAPLLIDYTWAKILPEFSACSAVIRHPSAPGDTRPQSQIDSDLAIGREYRDYMLIAHSNCGHVAGSPLPNSTDDDHTWVYIDPAGTPWVIGLSETSVATFKTVTVNLVALFGRFNQAGTVDRELIVGPTLLPGFFDPPEFEATTLEGFGFSHNESGSKAAFNFRERNPSDYLNHPGESPYFSTRRPPASFGDRTTRAIYNISISGTGSTDPAALGDGIAAAVGIEYVPITYTEDTSGSPYFFHTLEAVARWFEGDTAVTMWSQTQVDEVPGVSIDTAREFQHLDGDLLEVAPIHYEKDSACPAECFQPLVDEMVYAFPRDGGAVVTKYGVAIRARIAGLVHDQPWGSGGDWDVGNLWAAEHLKVATDPGEPAINAEMTDDSLYRV